MENKYDALGRPLADIEMEMAWQRKKVMDMEKEVEETVVKIKESRSVNRTLVYVGYFNYPCEGAVVEYSLEKGISRCWQEFHSPLDRIPMGYLYRCTKYSRVYHNLCPEFERFPTDCSQILSSLQQFLSMGQSTMPPMYVMQDHMKAAELTRPGWPQ